MNSFQFFFYQYLPNSPTLTQKYAAILVQYPLYEKYLYISTIHKLLSSLSEDEQTEFLRSLSQSELEAQHWLSQHKQHTAVIKEHLERSILAVT